jgi:capsular polysaccharide export protein
MIAPGLRRAGVRVLKIPQYLSLARARYFNEKNTLARDLVSTSMDLCQLRSLRLILGFQPDFHSRLLPSHHRKILGWGRKLSGNRAVSIAAETKTEFTLLEDGFLRSLGRHDDTLSLVFDDQGIYYDANSPSRIETLIAQEISPEEASRASEIIGKWRALRLSKYNSAPEYSGPLPKRYVLVLDQVAGDASIGYGKADQSSFDRMLRCALSENPQAVAVVKVHPDVFTRAKKGHLDIAALQSMDRVRIIAENCHPVRLIEHAEAIYTVTSQVGFEALIWGKKVRCLGMPFYAGWGVTQDELPVTARRKPVTLEQLVHGALVKYPRYVDPERQSEGEAEAVMDYLGQQRRQMFQFPAKLTALGFSRWKKPFLQRFLFGSEINFVKRPEDVPSDATLAIWGNTVPEGVANSVRVLHIEDGFLRSSGLGADLIQPLSWVVDDLGIYYDATRPSRLEAILQEGVFDAPLLERSRRLREQILSAGVSKYNLAGSDWERPAGGRRVILVPGQVENDASIRFGAPDIKTNIRLLSAVRAANPDAYIVYKPHPDVVAGLRRAGKGEAEASAHCDEIVTGADPVLMLAKVDEVHTMTSLLGFEALMRGVAVTCYGQPFYSGWGLTRDIIPVGRRTRRLGVDEVVAGALIEYPRYVSRVTNRYTSPERAVEELVEWRNIGPSRMPVWRRGLRLVLTLWARSGLRRNA